MSCGHLRQYLDAWLDGELDVATGAALADHVQACTACAALKHEREHLIERVHAASPRFAARPALTSAVQAALREVGRRPWWRWRPSQRPRWWQALAMAAGSAALATALTVLVLRLPAPHDDAAWADVLVAQHARSMAETLFDVRSDDRHTIKPWFQGKVDFAPTVRDLSAQGFVLEGARLDRLRDTPAAALVYRIRNHPINLFVWRADAAQDVASPQMSRARGFALARWTQDGLHFAAVSDVDPRDLERFAHAMAAPR